MLSSPTLIVSLIAALFFACFNRNKEEDNELRGHRQLSLHQYIDPATTVVKDTHKDSNSGYAPIVLNPKSTIFQDIEWIVHDPTLTNGVCVRFKQKARCPHPSLVGRLYGTSVTMLEWHQRHSIEDSHEQCGSYENSWLDSGTYFVEILVIHCNGFGPTSLEKTQSNPDHKVLGFHNWGAFDYTNECVEDPLRNRITGDNAYLTIMSNLEGAGNRHIGRWVQMDNSRFYSNGIPHQQYTRYQPQPCDTGHPDCLNELQNALDNSRIESQFWFEWNKDQRWIKDLEQYTFDFGEEFMAQHLPKPSSNEFHIALKEIGFKSNEPKICLMGDSHSHHLFQAMVQLNLGHRFAVSGK